MGTPRTAQRMAGALMAGSIAAAGYALAAGSAQAEPRPRRNITAPYTQVARIGEPSLRKS
jgi:hypothetical protein